MLPALFLLVRNVCISSPVSGRRLIALPDPVSDVARGQNQHDNPVEFFDHFQHCNSWENVV